MSLPIDHARLPKLGEILGGKYRLQCILGSGGMGVVFGATHLITHRRVAIKWLAADASDPSTSEKTKRFMREARLAGEFHHPNVVEIYDFGKSEGSFFMVMEWLEGETLAARLERVQRLSFQQASACLIPCMYAMQRAHDAGIIHRDLKPANIFLCHATADKPAASKVLDFGISKRITNNTDDGSLVTKTGMLIGTPQYLSPEQLRARPVDRRTDVYGFGVMLYETLAGEKPFIADNFGDLVVQISTSTPRSLRELVPDLPLGVEHTVARAMARAPEDRFQSLRELIKSLEAIDPSPLTAATLPQPITSSSLSPIATAPSTRRARGGLLRTRYALGMLAAGVGAALWLHQDDPGTRSAGAATARSHATTQPTVPPNAAAREPQALEAPTSNDRGTHRPDTPNKANLKTDGQPSEHTAVPRDAGLRHPDELTGNGAQAGTSATSHAVSKPPSAVSPATPVRRRAQTAAQPMPQKPPGTQRTSKPRPGTELQHPAPAPSAQPARDEPLRRNPLHMDIQ